MDGKRLELQALALEHGFASQAKAMLDDDIGELRQALASSRSQVASHAARSRSCSAFAPHAQQAGTGRRLVMLRVEGVMYH